MDRSNDLERLQEQYETGLAQYLKARGTERHTIMMNLLRLRWAAEDISNHRSSSENITTVTNTK